MARQQNQYFIGRQENVVYYQWKDGYYMRTKSSLNGKRFWKDKAFAGSRKRAVEFGEAAKLAAEFYHTLPKNFKRKGLFGQLTGVAHQWLLMGHAREVVLNELRATCGLKMLDLQPIQPKAACAVQYGCLQPASNMSTSFHQSTERNIKVEALQEQRDCENVLIQSQIGQVRAPSG